MHVSIVSTKIPFYESFTWLHFSQVTTKAYGSSVSNKLFFALGLFLWLLNIEIPWEITQNIILVHVYTWLAISSSFLKLMFYVSICKLVIKWNGKLKFDNLSIYKHRIIHRRVFVLGKRILLCNLSEMSKHVNKCRIFFWTFEL